MSLQVPTTTQLSDSGAKQPGLPATLKQMTGMLWYEMLSELNQTGLDPQSLGTGGDDFQSMFLWNIAQNDFGKYDSGLIAAAMRQVGGTGGTPPAPADLPEFPPSFTLPVSEDSSPITATTLATPENTQPATDLLTQAKNFAKAIWPQINVAAQALGVPPVAVLAQSALETGWGAAAAGNNLFGIKAVDGQPGTPRATHEMVDGVLLPQTASFRDYPSLQASISDYVGQIQAGYQNAVGQNSVDGFAQALQQGGYATDPQYAAKIMQLSQSPLMTQVLQALGGTAMPNSLEKAIQK